MLHILTLFLLVKKLCDLPTDQFVTKWFTNFLTDTIQSPKLYLRQIALGCGVPHGSVLGPLTFIVFIKNITKVLVSFSTPFLPMTRFNRQR